MMNRREFVQHLALLAAGASALPAQLKAFEHLYEVNTRPFGDRATGIVSIHDFALGFGGTPQDTAAVVRLMDRRRCLLSYALNRRSNMRIAVPPDCPVLALASDVSWSVDSGNSTEWGIEQTARLREDFSGHLRFTDQDGLIHGIEIDGTRCRLTEYLLEDLRR